MDLLFAPDDVEVAFAKPKCDVFGMGYSGLDRTSVLSVKANNPALALPDTFRMLDNKKKLAIRGQVATCKFSSFITLISNEICLMNH